jgi:hypothetical protein
MSPINTNAAPVSSLELSNPQSINDTGKNNLASDLLKMLGLDGGADAPATDSDSQESVGNNTSARANSASNSLDETDATSGVNSSNPADMSAAFNPVSKLSQLGGESPAKGVGDLNLGASGEAGKISEKVEALVKEIKQLLEKVLSEASAKQGSAGEQSQASSSEAKPQSQSSSESQSSSQSPAANSAPQKSTPSRAGMIPQAGASAANPAQNSKVGMPTMDNMMSMPQSLRDILTQRATPTKSSGAAPTVASSAQDQSTSSTNNQTNVVKGDGKTVTNVSSLDGSSPTGALNQSSLNQTADSVNNAVRNSLGMKTPAAAQPQYATSLDGSTPSAAKPGDNGSLKVNGQLDPKGEFTGAANYENGGFGAKVSVDPGSKVNADIKGQLTPSLSGSAGIGPDGARAGFDFKEGNVNIGANATGIGGANPSGEIKATIGDDNTKFVGSYNPFSGAASGGFQLNF